MTTANGEMDRGPFGEHVGGNDRRIKACQLLKILTRRSQHKFHLSLKAMLTLQEAPLCWVHGARHFHDLYNFQLSTDANQHPRKKNNNQQTDSLWREVEVTYCSLREESQSAMSCSSKTGSGRNNEDVTALCEISGDTKTSKKTNATSHTSSKQRRR